MKKDSEKDSNIILVPQFEELKNAIKRLRAEIPLLLQERDELLYVLCKNLEMEYMLKVGALECQAFKEECEYLRLKRKAELVQAYINRREKPDINEINLVLEREFEEYQIKLNLQYEKLEMMIERSKREFLSEKENRELKKLYYRIVKALHPDLNPEISEREKVLFLQAVEAYENGDLVRIRVISEAVADPKEIIEANTSLELNKEKNRLEKLIKTIHEDIAEIKGRFPYNIKEKIFDEDWVNQRRAELQDAIDSYKAAAEIYIDRIRELTGE
ncbi:MAG: hypothetical protein GX222_08560 [Ruminococcaceae bacterium]|nr:hypothetical protein [Oscillospiraceae bacterium]